MCPAAAIQEVKRLCRLGYAIRLVEHEGQCYAEVCGIETPNPPWGSTKHDILIAISASYPCGALDAFYIALPYTFNGQVHPRVNGGSVEMSGRKWQLTSWHYPEQKPWLPGQDNLETHITHCKGFFLHRGAVNEY